MVTTKRKNNLVIYDHTTILYTYTSDGLIQYLYLVSPHKESEDLIVKPLFKILQRFFLFADMKVMSLRHNEFLWFFLARKKGIEM